MVWELVLEPDELPVCAELELELVLDALAEVEEPALAEDEDEVGADEAEAVLAAALPEAEADDGDEDEAAEAAETILPTPQGIAWPSGCLALGGVVTAPVVSAMANRVVQVGSSPSWVNWKK